MGVKASLIIGQVATAYGRRTIWKHGVLRMSNEKGLTKMFVIVSNCIQIMTRLEMATSDGLSKGDAIRILERCPWKAVDMDDLKPDVDLIPRCPITLIVSHFPTKLRISYLTNNEYLTEIFIHPEVLNIRELTPDDGSRYDLKENRIGLSRTFECMIGWLAEVDLGTIRSPLKDACEEHLRNIAIWMEIISPGNQCKKLLLSIFLAMILIKTYTIIIV